MAKIILMAVVIHTIVMKQIDSSGFSNVNRVEACVNVVDTSYSRVVNVFRVHVILNRWWSRNPRQYGVKRSNSIDEYSITFCAAVRPHVVERDPIFNRTTYKSHIDNFLARYIKVSHNIFKIEVLMKKQMELFELV
ncbi:unnamed protein product [Spodoptera littoralis]|uniref:Uncharacterized protein n=1 Tax=Spodoptera littoralis TaxID=7109 RepID=A0A9P0IEW1_SPOLI|nr:unnamed protein product [Spodoptera littoralis]CAH1645853.1 unnamed protein product [Spodoptera littoralis]